MANKQHGESEILAALRERYGLRRTKDGLVAEVDSDVVKLSDRFHVGGIARAADGRVLGVILQAGNGGARRLCIAPYQAIREPKQLASYFEYLGLVPPAELRELKILATYITALAGLRSRVVLAREGIHQVSCDGKRKPVAVIGREVIGAPADEFLALPSSVSCYSSQGDLAGWQRGFKPLLLANPLMTLAACFALAVPLGSLLGFPLTGLLLAGASSTGKTTLARFVTSTFSAPREPHQWSGTANGIEALAALHADLPLSLDELGAGDIRQTLATIYRVSGGRAKARAYAYLTTPVDRTLTLSAEKRLKVLQSLDSLGAGFQLASHDLDIRGGGNLLGDEQSGHIREVGFELYQSMLEDAILAAKAGDMGLERDISGLSPQITIDAPIMIPEDYVPDLAVRMALYRRLNDAADGGEIDALAAEMIDRFGPLPSATENLVKLIEIKHQAIQANIAKIDVGARGSLVTFHKDDFPDPAGLMAYVERLKGTARLRPDMKLVIERAWGDPKSRLNGIFQLTKGLSAIAQRAGK